MTLLFMSTNLGAVHCLGLLYLRRERVEQHDLHSRGANQPWVAKLLSGKRGDPTTA